MVRYGPIPLVIFLWGCYLAGCHGPSQTIADQHKQIAELQSRNRKLVSTIEDQDKQIDEFNEVITILRKLGPKRLQKLYYVSKIEIHRRSGGTDYDGRIGDDGITLYLKLYDQDGHGFKAAGDIDVYIYDLTNPREQDLIAEYKYDVDKTKELWYGRLLTYHYRIDCPWQKRKPRGRNVLVRVTFLDYLTGRALQASREFEITPPLDDHPAESQ